MIFRGLDQQIFGVSLSSVYRTTSVPVAGLPTQDVQAIHRLPSGSLAQANRLVANITTDYRNCQRGVRRRPALAGDQAEAEADPRQEDGQDHRAHEPEDPAQAADPCWLPAAAVERNLT